MKRTLFCLVALLGLFALGFGLVSSDQSKPRTTTYPDFPPPPLSSQSAITLDYPIVYVRAPRISDTAEIHWSEGVNASSLMEPGADLMLYNPADGTTKVLVTGGIDSIADPYVSFDGNSIYYTRYYGPTNPAPGQTLAGLAGADIFRFDVATGQSVQLTNGELSPNRAADDSRNYVSINAQPCPLPDGGIAFVSNRSEYTQPRGYTRTNLQIYRMDADGSNVEKIGHLSLGCALHPMILRTGHLAFSSFETQNTRDPRAWSLWRINPDGSNFGPLLSQLTDDHVMHFGSQLTNGRIVCEVYYNQNDDGQGIFLAFNEPGNGPGFGPAWATIGQGTGANTEKNLSFRPLGFQNLTPWTTAEDVVAPLYNLADSTSPRVGKCTHPCGVPNNHLLAAWSPGPVNKDNGLKTPSAHTQIVLFPNGQPTSKPNQMLSVLSDPNYNLIWPRALASYQKIYGMPQPVILPKVANDGSASPGLPAGTPYGYIGTSSMYKRESFPNGFVLGVTGSQVPGHPGLDQFYMNDYTRSFQYQGGDIGVYANDDIYAIRIITMEPRTDYPNKSVGWMNVANERLRILGEIPVRKFSSGQQPLDPDGNPDTSFLAKIPADTPFSFQTLDVNGSVLNMAQTWHQVRPGEIKNDCGGCHAHSQKGTDFNATAAAKLDYQAFDLTSGSVPLVTSKANDTSGKQWDVNNQGGLKTVAGGCYNVEFFKDIKPILDNSCLPCHNSTVSPIPGNLDFSDYTTKVSTSQDGSTNPALSVPKVYAILASSNSLAGNTGCGFALLPSTGPGVQGTTLNLSRYVRKTGSRRSLLSWRVMGKRTDGYQDSSFPTETTKGDKTTLPATFTLADGTVLTGANVLVYADVDLNAAGNQYTQCPPPGNTQNIPALTDEQVRTVLRWIDLGCPIDLNPTGQGWFQDETPPTLTIQTPVAKQANPITQIRFGLADYNSGLDLTTLSVTADVAIDGNNPGTNLTSLFTATGGVYSYTLQTPLSGTGHLTISAADKTGNRVKRVLTFTVDPSYTAPVSPPAPAWQPLPEFLNPDFQIPQTKSSVANPQGWAGWQFSADSGIQSLFTNPTTQAGYLANQGTISQQVIGVAGSYTLTFQAKQNASGSTQIISVLVDGQSVATITPTSTTMASFTTPAFSLAATGPHTITFAGNVAGTKALVTGTSFQLLQASVVPATPTGLKAVASSSTQVDLTWTAVSGATSYVLQRSPDGQNWVNLASPQSASYSDTGLMANTTYYYQVQAVNSSGSSGWSAAVSATTPVAAPQAPTGLTATASSSTQIDLAWSTVSGATSYVVQRSPDGQTGWTTVSSPTTNSYSDTGLTASTTYYYWVQAVNSAGSSGWSSVVSATTQPPPAPSGLSATATQLTVSWSAFPGATSYNLRRSTDNQTWSLVVSGLTGTSYIDAQPPSGTAYYQVQAVTAQGTTAWSSSLTATVPQATANAVKPKKKRVAMPLRSFEKELRYRPNNALRFLKKKRSR